MSIRGFLKQWRERDKDTHLPPASAAQPKRQDDGLLEMTLSEFGRSGRFLRLRSRLLDDDFYLVAQESLKPELPDDKLVVYTAGEMKTLLMLDPTETTLRTIHELKKRFNIAIEN
ncbi:hypothetical protein ACFLQW_02130 [Candidatus Zixiibacteriota bacterium]